MQSVVSYGRCLARAIVAGISNEFPPWSRGRRRGTRGVHLVTAASGYGNHSHSPAEVFKKWAFGDDACFIAKHNIADVLGVADGVGGWRSYGVDPSQFSCKLMQTCEYLVVKGSFLPQQPAKLLEHSYDELLHSKVALIGSCTACIVALHREEETVYTTNLGDSGYLVVRDGLVIHRSVEQQHYFNTPFQLSVPPPTVQGQVLSDSPAAASSSSFSVEVGDIILVGTDGVFDNLSDDMILDHLTLLKDDSAASIQQTANQLVKTALTVMFDPDYMSPFAVHANENGINVKGGKPDDITVLLGRVKAGTGTTPDTSDDEGVS